MLAIRIAFLQSRCHFILPRIVSLMMDGAPWRERRVKLQGTPAYFKSSRRLRSRLVFSSIDSDSFLFNSKAF